MKINELKALDTYFDFPEARDFNPLSVASNITPPVLVCNNKIVWGKSIIQSIENSSISEVNVNKIEDEKKNVLLLALLSENRQNQYKFKEKLILFSIIHQSNLHEDPQFSEINLLIQSKGDFYQQMLSLSTLQKRYIDWVEDKIIDTKLALKINRFPESIFKPLEELLDNYSFSEKRILISNLFESSLRFENNQEKLQEFILQASEADSALDFSKSLRYPKMTEMQESWNDFVQKHKTAGIELDSPPSFEGNSFVLRIKLQSKKSILKSLDFLERIKEDSDELFRLLR